MDLDRGKLARIDRKLLAELGQGERFQMVRVPVTAAKWATWKRYCDAAGISMGRAVAALIERELVSMFDEFNDDDQPVFARDMQEQLAAREEEIIAREREHDAAGDRIKEQDKRLRLWEDELSRLELQVEMLSKLAARPTKAGPRVGRNERCPCGSGFKYKQCHGR
ncbi:hypothetical protein BH23ACT4_BH23ACT4_14030 [soil metagenome]